MLKWTVSRSLSTACSTPQGPGGGGPRPERRPFRDLSNTPPAAATSSRGGLLQGSEAEAGAPVAATKQRTPGAKRRRSRNDLRGYFQATKPSLRSSKRLSGGREGFYQGTPRVDADIGPLLPGQPQGRCPTLPVSASGCPAELPQNLVNEARANHLQSHVTDFFHQISMATSPEDVMEYESLPFAGRRRRGGLGLRDQTPHHTAPARPTPLAGKLLGLKLEQDRPMYENTDNTVTEVLNREQANLHREAKSLVAEVLRGSPAKMQVEAEETEEAEEAEEPASGNDSSVSSASQLLENPSPMSWAFTSPASDLEGEFPLKRQRVIRRKRQLPGNAEPGAAGSKRPKHEAPGFLEAVNHHVKRLALETDLDSPVGKETAAEAASEVVHEHNKLDSMETAESKSATQGSWETDSPKSSLLDSFATTTTSALGTPETPLVATVRRCLKYSPETPGAESQRHDVSVPRGSIEVECSALADCIHVRIIRCKELRRTYEGPVHAYVKASLRDPASGEGCVKRTAVHRATPNPVFNETLVLPFPPPSNNNCAAKQVSLLIAVWHRDRRARRSELLGCMTLPLPLSQDKEATWHPLEAGSGRNAGCAVPAYGAQEISGVLGGLGQTGGRGSLVVSPPLSKDGAESLDNSSGAGGVATTADDLTYLRHLELEPVDPLTGLPVHPGFTARGGRTPCTVTRRLLRAAGSANQVPWGFSLSWGRPPRVERVDPGSPAERSGLRPGDYVVFVESTNVVTQPRDDILELIQTATLQLVLEVYRRGGQGHAILPAAQSADLRRRSSVNVTLQAPVLGIALPAVPGVPQGTAHHHAIAFTAEALPNLAADAPPEEELSVREARYWTCLRSGQARFSGPLAEHRDVLSSADHMILFQNLEELLKLSEEIREEGGALESYLGRVGRITAAYRRYLGGLQRACCLLVALRKNSAFAKIVCEPAIPRRRKPDLTGLLLKPLEHYREMTRLLCQAYPRNCQAVRDLAQGYREATASAAVMEPPRDSGRPLLSLQEVESRLVFARCKPFALAVPGRQWLFGGALAKVEGRGRLQSTWALLLTDLLVFARVSRDRVLFVTEEPLRLACIAEACFQVRKRPTEFRLQVTTQPSAPGENPAASTTELVQCTGTGGGGGVAGGCTPHSRPRRRVLILRAPSPELKAVWHNLLQRQIIYVNTGCGGGVGLGATLPLDSPDDESPTSLGYIGAHEAHRELSSSPEGYRLATQQLETRLEEDKHSGNSLDLMLKESNPQLEENHLAQWVRNSHQIPPPDQEVAIEEWTPEELAARTPRESSARDFSEATEESTVVNSDAEQQSSASSASLSTVKSNSLPPKKSTSASAASSASMNICRRCHRSGCPTPPLLARDPFSPLPPKIAVLPPTPDLCSRHQRLRPGPHDSPGRGSFPADGNCTEDGSEDDLECEAEPPYRALRRFGTMSSLDQDDELEEQLAAAEEEDDDGPPPTPPPPPTSGLRAWTLRASSYVVSKMLLPPAPPERTEFSLEPTSLADEEGTASGATSGDDIWGTPTSGGPDDESFAGSPND